MNDPPLSCLNYNQRQIGNRLLETCLCFNFLHAVYYVLQKRDNLFLRILKKVNYFPGLQENLRRLIILKYLKAW